MAPHSYVVINSPDIESKRLWQSILCSRPFVAVLYMAPLLLAFFVGRYSTMSSNSHTQFNPAIQLNTVHQTFKYNRTFAEIPSNITNRAWEDIFPPFNGYFSHPTIAPHRSTLSAYHQLHCLNGIRQGYWAMHHAASKGEQLKDDDLPMMISAPHVRHCIDLIRQTLMCYADTTVEVKDEVAGGVHGFGVQHQCRDWKQLVRLTTEWQRQDQTLE